jgi:bacillithiol biosynthesis cysteine-adding enzyme BshC
MNVKRINYSQVSYWNHTDLAYMVHDKALREFYAFAPGKASIPDVIAERKSFDTDRLLLLNVLKKQYTELGLTLPFKDEVLLDKNTFTIITAHQPALMTGPLFHIYKIASTIHLTRVLNASMSRHTFIPVFIINSEDHDWAELNHFYLFGRKYEWDRNASGPCGRLSVEGLGTMVQTISDVLGKSLYAGEIKQMLLDSIEKAADYGHFHRLLLHKLFGRFGLVLLDMNDAELKRAFIPMMEKEIREQFSFPYVTETQSALEKAGFKSQAYCRPINLFYMTDQLRERLDPVDGGVIRVDSKVKYTTEEIIAELHSHPERFSPNVILRPLYQEYILPNLAYVGGGGELAYWLERKSQFKAAGIFYPMMIRRNSVLLIEGAVKSQLDKLSLQSEDLLATYDSLVKTYLHTHSQNELSYDEELELIRKAYDMLAAKADHIDPTLATAMLAEQSKQMKQFDQLGSRLLRSEKQLQETNLKRIQRIKEKLFPEGGLQERHENFVSFYANYGPQWIDQLVDVCDPWEEKFMILELQDQQPSGA